MSKRCNHTAHYELNPEEASFQQSKPNSYKEVSSTFSNLHENAIPLHSVQASFTVP